MRAYYHSFPYDRQNFAIVRNDDGGFPFAVDILDFETYHHTTPQLYEESKEIQIFKKLLVPSTVFVDIGANHGIFTLHAAHCMNKNISIHAFEPQDRPREVIKRSVHEGRLKNVQIHSSALGERSYTAEFYVPLAGSGLGSLLKDHADSARPRTVLVRPLDSFVEDLGIDGIGLVKIDVEGWEYQVLRGARHTLASQRPLIWFEANPSALGRAGHSVDDLFRILRSYGYASFIDVADLERGLEREIVGVESLTNILAVPDEKRAVLNRLVCYSGPFAGS